MAKPITILFVPCGGMWNSLTTACLFELGISPLDFDFIYGCSSSGPGISYWLANQRCEAYEAWVHKMTRFRIFHWIKLIFLSTIFQRWGLYAANVDYLVDHCCNDLDLRRVCELQRLRLIIYDVAGAVTEYIDAHPDFILEAFKASAAIPGLTKRIILNGREKVDGGSAHALPIQELLRWHGENCRFVVVLNHSRDYRPTPIKPWLANLAFATCESRAYEAVLRRHWEHENSINILNSLEREGRAYIIAPDRCPAMHGLSRRRKPVREAWKYGELLGQLHSDAVRIFLKQ